MCRNIIQVYLFIAAVIVATAGCKKEDFSFGQIKAPSDLAFSVEVVGASATEPNGDGSGAVIVKATSNNALTYHVDYGNGVVQPAPSGTITYKYFTPGTSTYTITVNAIGTGGAITTLSKQVTVFVAFTIPADMMDAFTGGSSKTFITDKNANGHFGVGPAADFYPIWYEAGPNTREACAYDDEITFTKNPNGTISMVIDNKGTSFSTAAATGFYGFSGGDGCYAINTGGTRQLAFMGATSNSTSAQSTRIQFIVPGNGIINFGTGGTTYEIISFSNNKLFLRSVGADGNAWYQRLIAKP